MATQVAVEHLLLVGVIAKRGIIECGAAHQPFDLDESLGDVNRIGGETRVLPSVRSRDAIRNWRDGRRGHGGGGRHAGG